MKLLEAIANCHVRSCIYRTSAPDIKYAKNHPIPFEARIPISDQLADDWEEYDPRDDDDTSLFMFND